MADFKIIILISLVCSCSFKKVPRQACTCNTSVVCMSMTRCLPPIIEPKSSLPPISQTSTVPIYYPQLNSAVSSSIHDTFLLIFTIFTINLYD